MTGPTLASLQAQITALQQLIASKPWMVDINAAISLLPYAGEIQVLDDALAALALRVSALEDAAVISPPPPSNDFFASDGATYPWYTNVFPSAAHDAGTNRTWFAYEGWDSVNHWRIVNVCVYDHTLNQWQPPVMVVAHSPLVNDDHGVPAICRDHQGYWHLFYGSHLSPCYHAVTRAPDDNSAWAARPTINISTGVSYPHPVMVGSTLHLFLRNGNYGMVDRAPLAVMSTTSLNNGIEAWGAAHNIIDYGSDSRVYQAQAFSINGKIQSVSTRSNLHDTLRRDVHYFIYDPADRSVSNFDGSYSDTVLPITQPALDAHYRIYQNVVGNSTIPALAFDSNGNAHVLLADGIGAVGTIGNYPIIHMALFNGVWSAPVQVGTSQEYGTFISLVPGENGVMSALWTQSATFAFGGDLKTATRSAGAGGTWGAESVLRAAGAKALQCPQMILNGTPAARMIFCEVDQSSSDSGAGGLKAFARSDDGYL